MKKILVLGSSGMLGNTLVSFLNKEYSFIGIDKEILKDESQGIKFYQLDLLQFHEVKKIILQEKPDIIINVAAIVNLDLCEKNLELASNLHINLSQKIAKISRKMRIKYIYISTDSVFDGEKSIYTEEDAVNPLNNYAKTKFLGEEEAKKAEDYIIIRTNIYGYSKNQHSLFKWAYNELKNNHEICGYMNVIFNPVSVLQLSDAIGNLIKKDFRGVINIASNSVISKFEFLKMIEKKLKKQDLINPSILDDTSIGIRRPKNTSLTTKKMQTILDKEYLIEDGINQIFGGIENENRK